MTLNDLLDQTGRAVVKQGKRRLMDPKYQRRKIGSKRSTLEPISDTGKLNRSFKYVLDNRKSTLAFEYKKYGDYVDQGTKKIKPTYWFTGAYDEVMINFDKKLDQYVNDMVETEFKSVYKEFGI